MTSPTRATKLLEAFKAAVFIGMPFGLAIMSKDERVMRWAIEDVRRTVRRQCRTHRELIVRFCPARQRRYVVFPGEREDKKPFVEELRLKTKAPVAALDISAAASLAAPSATPAGSAPST